MDHPRAVLFDAYGTLFDVYSVGLLAEQLFPGQGQALSLLWRDKQIEYTRIASMSGRYRPFWDLTRAGLRFAADLAPYAFGPYIAKDRKGNYTVTRLPAPDDQDGQLRPQPVAHLEERRHLGGGDLLRREEEADRLLRKLVGRLGHAGLRAR